MTGLGIFNTVPFRSADRDLVLYCTRTEKKLYKHKMLHKQIVDL